MRLIPLALLAVVAAAQTPVTDDSVQSYRIRFGLTDTAEKRWDGTVTVSGGELLQVRDMHPRPENEIRGPNSWRMSTLPGVNYVRRPWEPLVSDSRLEYLWSPGVIVDVKASSGTRVNVRTEQGRFAFNVREVPLSKPKAFLNGAVVVDRVAGVENLGDSEHEDDYVSMLSGEDGEVWVCWVAYKDDANEVFVRRFDGTSWGAVQTVTEKPGDVFLAKMGRDAHRRPWVVWSNQVGGNFDLYGRRLDGSRWGEVVRLTDSPQPDIFHNLATDSEGRLWLTWQGFRDGQADIFARLYDGAEWGPEQKVSTSSKNDWEPVLAADSSGGLTIAWDTYDKGDYDVVMRRFDGESWGEQIPVADSKLYEAHVSLVYDKQDRLWAAYNESGLNWGKDTGYVLSVEGTRLYEDRLIRVAVWDGSSWKQPASDINSALPQDIEPRYDDFPQLALDGDDRVWVFGRQRLQRRRDTPSETPLHRACWEIWGSTLDGSNWIEPVYVPRSQSRQDVRWGLASDGKGNLFAAWQMDNRDYSEFLYQHADVYASKLPNLERTTAAPKLAPRPKLELTFHDMAPTETEDLERIRNYEISSGGKTYKIYRGDTHRHSEISMDGNNDGSTFQTYRYAIDAAKLDYLLTSEHNSSAGPDQPYINWMLQQYVDVFSIAGEFQPFYGYERSISYPDGHRNILFAERGNPALEILPEERNHTKGAARLYAYLKERDGIAISHTSATGMGTDWRDNDPEVEPLVEIFQGDRVSAEYEGAHWAANKENPASGPGGFRPAGYVWNAWAKGYKLGIQAASDHLSTHMSYACTIAEDFTRESMLDAMKKRHSYGATDNIILDYRLVTGDGKEYLQGEEVTVNGDFKLSVKVIGTASIRQIDVMKNQEFVFNRQNQPRETSFTYVDEDKAAGEDYYYVRVIQNDDNIAWSSPIWVTRR